MTSVECNKITCRFDRVLALDRLSFQAPAGSWTYVLGPTASGKTTLLRAVAGLQPLASGQISLGGRLASNRRIVLEPHRRAIGLIPQEPSLWPHLTAVANVALAIPGARLRGPERKARAMDRLAQLGLDDLAPKFPAQLSGGEARSVALARALASEPRLLLLDEPTAHLDVHLRGSMMALLLEAHKNRSLTTICVTHQIEPPMRLDDRVLLLDRGRLAYDGSLGKLEGAPQTEFVRALSRMLDRLQMRPDDGPAPAHETR